MVDNLANLEERLPPAQLKKEVLILGGGFSGTKLASFLARHDVKVTVIERGEKQDSYFCLDDKTFLRSDLVPENVTFLPKSTLVKLSGHLGSFQATITTEGNRVVIEPSVIVIATGYSKKKESTFLPPGKTIFLEELAELLKESKAESLTFKGRKIDRISFIFDQVNDDIKIPFFLLFKTLLSLKSRFSCETYVFCKDVKVSFPSGERLYRKAREEGVLFFKYEDFPAFSDEREDFLITWEEKGRDPSLSVNLRSDLLVIPEHIFPGDASSLSAITGIPLNKGGYLMEDNPQFLSILTNRKGIYVLGGCHFPHLFTEVEKLAYATATEILKLFYGDTYHPSFPLAQVDPQKCALCYTCVRICPHKAVTIEKYAERNIYYIKGNSLSWYAAYIERMACFGCGICIAECPARAISFIEDEVKQ